jgi:hypothetical protein
MVGVPEEFLNWPALEHKLEAIRAWTNLLSFGQVLTGDNAKWKNEKVIVNMTSLVIPVSLRMQQYLSCYIPLKKINRSRNILFIIVNISELL